MLVHAAHHSNPTASAPPTGPLSSSCCSSYELGLWCAVTSTGPLQSGIGQVDDIAVWSRALGPLEVLRVFTEGIRESDSDLSLFYNFNEGTGAYARNRGRAGAQYDLVLGRSEVGGPTAYHVANKFGGSDQIPFTQPVWALPALAESADSFVPRCKLVRPVSAAAAPKGEPMPCSAADAPTAKDAFDKAAAGDVGGAMALLSNLDGGMAGTCGACLRAQQSTPEKAMPTCVGTKLAGHAVPMAHPLCMRA